MDSQDLWGASLCFADEAFPESDLAAPARAEARTPRSPAEAAGAPVHRLAGELWAANARSSASPGDALPAMLTTQDIFDHDGSVGFDSGWATAARPAAASSSPCRRAQHIQQRSAAKGAHSAADARLQSPGPAPTALAAAFEAAADGGAALHRPAGQDSLRLAVAEPPSAARSEPGRTADVAEAPGNLCVGVHSAEVRLGLEPGQTGVSLGDEGGIACLDSRPLLEDTQAGQPITGQPQHARSDSGHVPVVEDSASQSCKGRDPRSGLEPFYERVTPTPAAERGPLQREPAAPLDVAGGAAGAELGALGGRELAAASDSASQSGPYPEPGLEPHSQRVMPTPAAGPESLQREPAVPLDAPGSSARAEPGTAFGREPAPAAVAQALEAAADAGAGQSTPETHAYALETQMYLHDSQRPASQEATLPYCAAPREVRRGAAPPERPAAGAGAPLLDEDSVLTIGYGHLLHPNACNQAGGTADFNADSVMTIAYERAPAEISLAEAEGRRPVAAAVAGDYDTIPYEAGDLGRPRPGQVQALPPLEADVDTLPHRPCAGSATADMDTLPHEPFTGRALQWLSAAPVADMDTLPHEPFTGRAMRWAVAAPAVAAPAPPPPASATPATPPKLPKAPGAAPGRARGGPSGGPVHSGRAVGPRGRTGGPAPAAGLAAVEETPWLAPAKRRRREEPSAPAAAAAAPRWRGQRVIQVEATPPPKPLRPLPSPGGPGAGRRQMTLEESFSGRNGRAISVLDSDD